MVEALMKPCASGDNLNKREHKNSETAVALYQHWNLHVLTVYADSMCVQGFTYSYMSSQTPKAVSRVQCETN